MKAAPHDRFRAHVSWNVDDADLRSPFHFHVFERVVETAGPLVLADLVAQPSPRLRHPPFTRRFAASSRTLIGSHGRVLGALCVFDVKPIAIGGANLDGLQALGRRVGLMIEALAPMPSDSDETVEQRHRGTGSDDASADLVTGLPTRGESTAHCDGNRSSA